MRILLIPSLIFLCLESNAQPTMLTDSRDGQTYKTIEFEIPLQGGVLVKRTWMLENLNYKTPDSFCYGTEQAYCEVYGRLYTFESAKSACPEGWRLPMVKDWQMLASKYGGMSMAGNDLIKGGTSGMNLLLGGFGDPRNTFKNIGISGNYWDAENQSANTAGLITVQARSQFVYQGKIGNWHRNSVRCIMEYNQ